MRKVGIIGGMGPEATLDLFRKIIALTPAKCDQAHIPILIDNNPQIPDRTTFLLNGGDDPLPHLVHSAKWLEMNGAEVICMPCNTAHFFLKSICQEISVPFISMIEATCIKIMAEMPLLTKVGLLATTGTVKKRIYHDVFEKRDIEVCCPDDFGQEELMATIYGVKAGALEAQIPTIHRIMQEMADNGVEAFIAGCTELPLLFGSVESQVPVVDPTRILAKKLVSFSLSH